MTDYKCEKVLPYNSSSKGKKEQVEQMFDTIAEKYDPMNRLMSLGNDRTWRKKAILSLKKTNPKKILDIATGTGDFAITAYELLSPEKITGIDLSEGMLKVGQQKIEKLNLANRITLQVGDSTQLDFDTQTFDAVTVAFGVRNFESLSKGLSEICRVLKTGGVAVILELSEPQNVFFKFGYKLYTKLVIPVLARFISKDIRAYNYLPQSIEAFPQGREMKALLHECGFSQVEVKTFTFGSCSFYRAVK
jgi:demethylmenaquinone methyltransferase/2-methoxy-6-polyprenyl-1,4-benzoquinol methylase